MASTNGLAVSVFRALYGKYNSGVNDGVTDDQLRRTGVFCENSSYAQTEDNFLAEGTIQRGGYVVGLPVFTNIEQAKGWMNNRTYGNLPALTELDIPLNYLLGDLPRLAIVSNNINNPDLDRILNQDEIQRLLRGERLDDVGECVLREVSGDKLTLNNTRRISPDLVRELRKNERFFRPTELKDGKLLPDALMEEVRISDEPTEASSEISVK